MNKHILLVMKWLNDPTSVTKAELQQNHKDSIHAFNSTDSMGVAQIACTLMHIPSYAEKEVTKYFERTGEDRTQYADALTTPEDALPTNGQKLRYGGATITFIGLSPTGQSWVCANSSNDTLEYFNPHQCTPVSPEGEAMQAIIDGATDPVTALLKAGYHL